MSSGTQLSLNQRALLAVGIMLLAFLGLTGLVLDRAFRSSAEQSVHQRLEAHLYGLLAISDISESGELNVPNFLADSRFNQPGSGLYAQIFDKHNNIVWQSRSLAGQPDLKPQTPTVGTWRFLPRSEDNPRFELAYGVVWELLINEIQTEQRYSFIIAESDEVYVTQVDSFRQSLWSWLATATLILLVGQMLVVRWGLAPLRRVESQLNELQHHQRERLDDDYPRELNGLTSSMNRLMDSQQRQLERYRNALGDLAHSLKTPLAILRGLDANAQDRQVAIDEQTGRMKQIVDYHLQRAATAGHSGLIKPETLQPILERICRSLQKVYHDRNIKCHIEINLDFTLSMDEGDIMEMLGNLLDNAFKWSSTQVRISSDSSPAILIEDDGPGIKPEVREQVLNRGIRADSTVDGQGIGLAVARDILESYGGAMSIEDSEWKGAKFILRIQSPTD